jgi:hypothetical protein
VVAVWIRAALRPAGDPRRERHLLDDTIAVLVAWAALGTVFSPQYLVWILPLAVLRAQDGAPWRLVALLAATQIVYPIGYPFLVALSPALLALVLARNLGLLFWAARLPATRS